MLVIGRASLRRPPGGLSGGDGGQSGRRARRPDPCLPPSVCCTENALECSGPDRALSTRGLLCRVALRSPPPPRRAHRSSESPESHRPPAFPRKGTHGRTHHPLPSRVVTPGQCGETDCFCRSRERRGKEDVHLSWVSVCRVP